MCQENQDREGYVISVSAKGREFMLSRAERTEIWPINLEDPGKSNRKPYPQYRGSARSEGPPNTTFHQYWLKQQGFQPCVLELEYTKMRSKESGEMKRCRAAEDKLRVAALVRYANRVWNNPELRIITVDANERTQEKFTWKRQPVVIAGDSSAARREVLVEFINSLRTPEDKTPEPAETPAQEAQQAEIHFEDSPW